MTLAELKQAKLDRIAPLLKPEFRDRRTPGHFDCLDEATRRQFDIVETENVSENVYHLPALQLFARHEQGLVLDFGAGKRGTYLGNVVNLEVVPYESTDVIGVGERLPFSDGVFDAVHSNAVLEHVKDPFACAREIERVLKPGGDLMCCVPFLQPYHGYPHHYYNMTHQGLRNLFPGIEVLGIEVYEELRPATTLKWIINAWAAGLPDAVREQFLNLRLGDFSAQSYESLKTQPYVTQLGAAQIAELASCNTLFGKKPGRGIASRDKTLGNDTDAGGVWTDVAGLVRSVISRRSGSLPDRETGTAAISAGLQCDTALFGAGDTWSDVTKEIRSLIVGDGLFVSCSTDLQPILGDPLPGISKQLKVQWHTASASGETVIAVSDGRLSTPLWL